MIPSRGRKIPHFVQEYRRNSEANHDIPNFEWQRVLWLSPTMLSYVEKINGYPNIWSYDLDTGKDEAVDEFQPQPDLFLRVDF